MWFSDVPNLGRTVVIFTLNYDLAVETASRALQGRDPNHSDALPVELVDGLGDQDGEIGRRWSARAFREYRAVRGRSNVVLVKLHGSVRWARAPPSLALLSSCRWAYNGILRPMTPWSCTRRRARSQSNMNPSTPGTGYSHHALVTRDSWWRSAPRSATPSCAC